MFIIVTSDKKSKRRLFEKKVLLEQNIKNGATFFKLNLKNPGCIKDKKIIALIGRSPVMFSNPVKADQDRFNPVDDNDYSLKLMQNGVKQMLVLKKLTYKTVVLIDLKCKFQELADILLEHCKTLKIVTSRKEMYQNYVEAKLYECGAAIIIEENLDKLDRSALYVSPSGILLSKINAEDVFVVSMRPIIGAKANVIHSFRAATPQKYREILPNGVSEHIFQAALYNYCGKRELAKAIPQKITLNDTVFELENFQSTQNLQTAQTENFITKV